MCSTSYCERVSKMAVCDQKKLVRKCSDCQKMWMNKMVASSTLNPIHSGKYSGAKKYLVSHQLCKLSHLKR